MRLGVQCAHHASPLVALCTDEDSERAVDQVLRLGLALARGLLHGAS